MPDDKKSVERDLAVIAERNIRFDGSYAGKISCTVQKASSRLAKPVASVRYPVLSIPSFRGIVTANKIYPQAFVSTETRLVFVAQHFSENISSQFDQPSITIGDIECTDVLDVETSTGERGVSCVAPDFEKTCNATDCSGYVPVIVTNHGVSQAVQCDECVSFSLPCTDGAFSKTTTNACSDIALEASTGERRCSIDDNAEYRFKCPLGTKDRCTPCPSGAFCPGGNVAWPKCGYFVFGYNDSSPRSFPRVEKCPIPSSERCPGYNASLGFRSGQCGVGYEGDLCVACSFNFYNPDKSINMCIPCPNARSVLELFRSERIGLVLAALIGLLVVSTLCVVGAAKKKNGGTLRTGFRRALHFTGWSVLTLQFIAQAGETTPKNAIPTALLNFQDMLELFQMNVAPVHPDCTDAANPFVHDSVHLIVVLLIWVLSLSIMAVVWHRHVKPRPVSPSRQHASASTASMSSSGSYNHRNSLDTLSYGTRASEEQDSDAETLTKAATVLSYFFLQILGLLYARTCSITFRLLHCEESVDAKPRLASNPLIVCGEGSHAMPSVLAWASLIFYLIGFPLVTYAYIAWWYRDTAKKRPDSLAHRSRNKHKKKRNSETAFKYFASASFKRDSKGAKMYWFRHIFIIHLFVVAFMQEWCAGLLLCGGTIAASLTSMSLLLYFQPYSAKARWKHATRLYMLFLLTLIAVFNYYAVERVLEYDETVTVHSMTTTVERALSGNTTIVTVADADSTVDLSGIIVFAKVVLVLSYGLIGVLVINFVQFVFKGAAMEEAQVAIQRTTRLKGFSVASTMSSGSRASVFGLEDIGVKETEMIDNPIRDERKEPAEDPKHWQKHFSAKHASYYFHNPATGESVWENKTGGGVEHGDREGDDSSFSPWTSYVDEATGRPYWHNSATNETTWICPGKF